MSVGLFRCTSYQKFREKFRGQGPPGIESPDTRRRGWLDSDSVLDSPGTVLPFVELTPGAYRWEQTVKSWLRRFGYYSLFPSGTLR